jgi:hypothetical protein
MNPRVIMTSARLEPQRARQDFAATISSGWGLVGIS